MATPVEAKQIFNGIAWRYDYANRVISFGTDLGWRNQLSNLCAQNKPQRILDVACGTGDQILSLQKFNQAEIVGVDLLEKMVIRGKKKIGVKEPAVAWFLGNGVELPFKTESFDAITISFGLRNLPSVDLFLKEAKRILKPNGKLWVLEFSQPKSNLFKQIYYFYLKNILPLLGKVLTGTRASYDYLARTIEAFPNQEKLKESFVKAGFKKVCYLNLSFGIVAIHSGEV